jgi:hypothetical protein
MLRFVFMLLQQNLSKAVAPIALREMALIRDLSLRFAPR